MLSRFAVLALFFTLAGPAFGLEERILGNRSALQRDLIPADDAMAAPEKAPKAAEKPEEQELRSLSELTPRNEFLDSFNEQWNQAKPPSEPYLAPHVQKQRKPRSLAPFYSNNPTYESDANSGREDLAAPEGTQLLK